MSFAIDSYLLDGDKPKTSRPGVWLVRVKPHNPRLGYVLRRVRLRKHKLRLDVEDGWRELKTMDEDMLLDLATLRQDPTDDQTPLALDICTVEEAKAVEMAEERRRLAAAKKATVARAGVLSSEDLPSTAASRRERMRVASELRAAEHAGDVAQRRKAPEPESAEEIEAEIGRLRAKLRKSDAGDEKPRAAQPGGKPRASERVIRERVRDLTKPKLDDDADEPPIGA